MTDLIEKIVSTVLTVSALVFGVLSLLCAFNGVELFKMDKYTQLGLGLILLVFFIALAMTHYIQYDCPFWRREDQDKRTERLALDKRIKEHNMQKTG